MAAVTATQEQPVLTAVPAPSEEDRPAAQGGHGGGLPVPVHIMGSGVHLPSRIVTNADLAGAVADLSEEWVLTRVGVRERRYLEQGRNTSDMCVDAALRALADARLDAADLDAIVLATSAPDQPMPSTAIVVGDAIGARHAIPLDLNQAACAGGTLAMLVGAHLLQNPRLRHVLVIGAEAWSRIIGPHDRTTRSIFGDAAAAVVMGPTRSGYGLLSWDFGASLSYNPQIRGGGTALPLTESAVADGLQYLQMEGRGVWDDVMRFLPPSILRAVELAGLTVPDIRHVVVHQANRRLVTAVLERVGAASANAPITLDVLGNTGAASVFTALHQLLRDGAVRSGDHVLVSAIGAGLAWYSLCFRAP